MANLQSLSVTETLEILIFSGYMKLQAWSNFGNMYTVFSWRFDKGFFLTLLNDVLAMAGSTRNLLGISCSQF
jgi:hypothetical protein